MKFCTALFFGFLIFNHGSLAYRCEPMVRVNTTLIVDNYAAYVNSLPRPTLEYGDLSAGGFEDIYTGAVHHYGRNLMLNLYDESNYRGDELVRNIRKLIDELKKLIDSLPKRKRDPNCLDEALGRVIGQMNTYLNLKPQNTEFQMPELPPLPVQPEDITSRSAVRTTQEIFCSFVDANDYLANQMYVYLTKLFLSGWDIVRKDFEVVRTQVYKEILNGAVINAYGEAVVEVRRCREVIYHNVSKKTWQAFEDAAKEIIEIWKNCNVSDMQKPYDSNES